MSSDLIMAWPTADQPKPELTLRPWPPTRYTKPLSENFPSLWDFWGEVVQALWQDVFNYQLEDWQCQLLRHITELFPRGHKQAGKLRHRSSLTSISSQQGKTECETALVFIFMLEFPTAKIRSVAANLNQAKELYDRAFQLVFQHPEFGSEFNKPTETRGLTKKSGAFYQVATASEKALQSFALQLGIADEVHLLDPKVWDTLIARLGSRPNSMVSGITTAGDENSLLLVDKYRLAEEAIALPPSKNKLGAFFIWEAPEARVPEDDDTLWEYLLAAGPAYHNPKRYDKDTVVADVRGMHPNSLVRYKLNRFTNSLSALLPLSTWLNLAAPPKWEWPKGRYVLGVARDEYDHMSVARAIKAKDGKIHTELVMLQNEFDTPWVIEEVTKLYRSLNCLAVCMPGGEYWKELRAGLEKKGVKVATGNIYAVSSLFYAKVTQNQLIHADDEALRRQIPMTIRRERGAEWRIERNATNSPIDSVEATAFAVYGAENVQPVKADIHFF